MEAVLLQRSHIGNVVGVGSRCSSGPRPAPAPASSAESLDGESRLGRHRASQFLQAVQMPDKPHKRY